MSDVPAEAPPEMNVVFTDKYNKYQYDSSATAVYTEASTGMSLFLGDRESCSMVQLQHRQIKSVVICASDMHGLAKEAGIRYCNIDPVDNERVCLDLSCRFICQALQGSESGSGSCTTAQDILVCCSTGLGRSAAVALHFLMKNSSLNLTLAQAHQSLQARRPGAVTDSKTAGFRPELLQLLLAEERAALGHNTVSLKGRKMAYLGAEEIAAAAAEEAAPASAFPVLPITSKDTLQCCRSLDCSADQLPSVFIASYPKSGTTWTQAIVYELLALGNTELAEARPSGLCGPDDIAETSSGSSSSSGNGGTHISDYSPFYEVDNTWADGALPAHVQESHRILGHRVFNTHLLPSMLPPCRKDGRNKYIYVMRSGPDACYSFYHHLSNQDDASGGTGSSFPAFPAFVQQWLDGKLPYGRWNEHVCMWMQTHRNACESYAQNVLFVQYEDLVSSLEAQVQRIAQFLGLSALSAEQLVLLLPKLTFSGMRSKSAAFSPVSVRWKDPSFNFLRKGTVGDSRVEWAELCVPVRDQFKSLCTESLSKVPISMHAMYTSLVPTHTHGDSC